MDIMSDRGTLVRVDCGRIQCLFKTHVSNDSFQIFRKIDQFLTSAFMQEGFPNEQSAFSLLTPKVSNFPSSSRAVGGERVFFRGGRCFWGKGGVL